MKKNLPLLKNVILKSSRALHAVFFMLLLFGLSTTAHAQLVYAMGETSSSTPVAADLINRVNYDGSNVTTIATGASTGLTQPGFIALDGNNNRLFISELYTSGNVIKVLNATTGAVIRTITSLNSMYIKDVAYDVTNDWLYYITEGGSITVTDANDAVYRVHADGTGAQILATSITKNPYRIEIDAASNKVYVLDVSFSGRALKTIDLANSNAVTSRSFASSAAAVYDFAIDKVNGYIYYLTENANPTTLAATDALKRQNMDGTNDVVLVPSIANTPFRLALDLGNNRAYVSDAYNATAKIIAVNLLNNTFTTALTLPQGTTAPVLSDIAVPEQPIVSTGGISALTATSATFNGVLNYGYGFNTERGVVYSSTNSTPTVSDSKVSIATNTSNGNFSGNIGGLTPATTYNVRAYAINGAGTTYGGVATFSTPSNDANLSNLTISQGTLNPSFSSGTNAYAVSVSAGVSSVTVTPTKTNAGATLKVNGTTVASGSASSAIALGVGTNTITTVVTAADGTTTKTYTITVTRAKGDQTIALASTASKTYGDADYSPGATASSGLAVSYTGSSNTAVATIVNNQVHIVGAGTTTITASQAGDVNYNAATDVTQTLTVGAKAITVTANANQSKVYGNNDPTFTYTVTGVVNGDTPTGALSRATPNTNRFIGTYPIDQGTLSYGNNYNITYVNANLTINKRPITVLPIAKTKVYGDADPFLNQYSIAQGSSLAPGDGSTDQFGRAAGESVGSYLMTLGNKKFISDGVLDVTSNYDITVQQAYFTITAKPITVNANAQTKAYGDADPVFTYTDSGLAFSDTFAGSLTRATGEVVGTYAITKGTLALNSNYTLTFTGNNLTIGKRAINVAANTSNKTYGDADPVLGYTVTSGSVATGDAFTGALGRQAGENMGTYAINQGSLALNSNYNLIYAGAGFIITPKLINVSAQTAGKTYGDTDPALSYTADALIAGDSFTGNIMRVAGENAGAYAINQGTLALGTNYTLNYTPANFTIDKKVVTVSTPQQNVPYGDPDQSIGYSYNGLLAGDTFIGHLGRAAGNEIGSYTVNVGTLSAGDNYSITLNASTYNIVKRVLQVTGGPTIKTYGDTDPAISYSIYQGSLLAGDLITGSLVRVAGENAGPYNVSQGSLAVSDPAHYDLQYLGGYFEIDRAPLTVKADDKTKIVNDPNPTFTYTITGFKNGDTEATAFQNPVGFFNLPLANAPVGSYDIYLSDIYAQNYNVTTQSGVLTVNPKSDNADLSALVVAGGDALSPAFDPATTDYVVNVPEGTSTVTITPTVAEAHASVMVNYYTIASGSSTYAYLSSGDNYVPITVTAQNGTTKQYNLTVKAPLGKNAQLSGLYYQFGESFDSVPGFDPAVHTYTMNVPSNYTSLRLVPFTADYNATVAVNGNPYEGYFGAFLNTGANLFTFVVTSQDGAHTETYSITINRALSANNNLYNLSLSQGTLSPAFNNSVANYTASVPGNVYSINVYAPTADTTARVKVNGEPYTYGYAVGLHSGSNTINLEVKAKNGDIRTFTLVVDKAISNNAMLASLDINGGSLTPSFSANMLNYVTRLDGSTTVANVNAIAADPAAQVRVNGNLVTSSAPQPIAIYGNSSPVKIDVTAEDGTTTQTYNVTVNRITGNALLSSLETSSDVKLKQQSNTTTLVEYTAAVGSIVSSFTVKPTVNDASATVTINGVASPSGQFSAPIPLSIGTNTVNVVVTADDGTTIKTYRLTITKSVSSNALLSSIETSPAIKLKQTSNTATLTEYTATVAGDVTSLSVKPVLNDLKASVTVNGTTVASGTLSAAIPLTQGVNNINTVVTAEDGTTVKTYRIVVTQVLSANAVATVETNPALKYKTTVTGVNTLYEATVGTDVTTLAIKPTVSDAKATVTVNGTPVTSGVFTDAATIAPGLNTFDVVVTAENGTTNRHYQFAITQTRSSNALLSSIEVSPNVSLKLQSTSTALNVYTASVNGTVSSIVIKPVLNDLKASVTVNGMPATSGNYSLPVMIVNGVNTIDVQVTAQDGVTTKMYRLVITKALSSNALLNAILTDPDISLKNQSNTATLAEYSATVSGSVGVVNVKPVVNDLTATVTVNGTTTANGTATPVLLSIGLNTVDVVVTAEDGVTTKTYRLAINKVVSSDATLLAITNDAGISIKSQSNNATLAEYKATAGNSVTSIAFKGLQSNASASITINGTPLANNTYSGQISLAVGLNTIDMVVTAEDGVTTKTYRVDITRQGAVPLMANKDAMKMVSKNTNSFVATDDVVVHQGVSPNGDGVNDYLVIEGLSNTTGNKLSVMNAAGTLVFETKDYGKDGSNLFTGRSRSGDMLKAGTYYYLLDYQVGKETKRKTGFLILKY